jgi:hypothetical protein
MLSSLLSLAGGALTGLSAVLLLVFKGRIVGISGVVGGLFGAIDARLVTNSFFVIGLGPLLFLTMIAQDRLNPRLNPTEPMKGARP